MPGVMAETAVQDGSYGYAVGAVRSVRRPSQTVVEAKKRSHDAIQAAKLARSAQVRSRSSHDPGPVDPV